MGLLGFPQPTLNRSMSVDEDGGRWYPMMSRNPVKTKSGINVDERSSLTIPAYWCGVRVLAEAMAILPYEIIQCSIDKGRKRTDKQYEHRLWNLLNHEPNSEQDAMVLKEFMFLMMCNWGNFFAEIVRDSVTGEVVELWPIHSSRIPKHNVVRGPVDVEEELTPGVYRHLKVGDPGELIYFVNNDDGTRSPLSKRDILHIPGVLSEDGLWGKAIPRWMAESLGLAYAQDQHVQSFFGQGAHPSVVVKVPGSPDKEKREELRTSFGRMYRGSDKAHEMVLLWGGMEVEPIQIDPSTAQLLESRAFSVNEVARMLKLPLHMLADMTQGKYKNIEEENIGFVTRSLQPWVERSEQALRRQLLTDEEKQSGIAVRAKMRALMRGDMKSLMDALKVGVGIAAFSPNDVREELDENPIDGGDEHFIAANNLQPLSLVLSGNSPQQQSSQPGGADDYAGSDEDSDDEPDDDDDSGEDSEDKEDDT